MHPASPARSSSWARASAAAASGLPPVAPAVPLAWSAIVPWPVFWFCTSCAEVALFWLASFMLPVGGWVGVCDESLGLAELAAVWSMLLPLLELLTPFGLAPPVGPMPAS